MSAEVVLSRPVSSDRPGGGENVSLAKAMPPAQADESEDWADWRFLAPGPLGRVLEISMGGPASALIHLAPESREVWACDPDPGRIAREAGRAFAGGLDNVHLFRAASQALPLRDRSFDLIAVRVPRDELRRPSRTVLSRLLATCRRALAPGGCLVLRIEPAHSGRWPSGLLAASARRVLERAGFEGTVGWWAVPRASMLVGAGRMDDRRTLVEYVRSRRPDRRRPLRTDARILSARLGVAGLFSPAVVIVARASGAPREPYASALARSILDRAQGPHGDLEPVLLRSNRLPRGRILFGLFEPGQSRPSWMLKIARAQPARDVLRREREFWSVLVARCPLIAHGRPRWYGDGLVLEPFVPGGRIRDVWGRPEHEDLPVAWLGRLHREGADGSGSRDELLRDTRDMLGPDLDEAGRVLLGEFEARIAGPGFRLPLVPVHGDFTPSNLLLDGGSLHVTDWEWARLGGWPLDDLWTFLIVGSRNARAARVSSPGARIAATLAGRSSYSERAASVALRFAGQAGYPSRLVPAFALRTLLGMADSREHRRLDWNRERSAVYGVAAAELARRIAEFREFWAARIPEEDG